MTYAQALEDSTSLFSVGQYAGTNLILETGEKPLEAYRVFKTKAAADIVVAGDNDGGETYYDIYPGALVTVVKDASAENNGTYMVEVVQDSQSPLGREEYRLVKLYSENDNVGGNITVKLKDESGVAGEERTNPYIFFVGVDSSADSQQPEVLYFNDGFVYDASGNTILNNSDERLKDVIEDIDVDLDKLKAIQKMYFSWKGDKSRKRCVGVTAQSVEKVYPELVAENPKSGYKMVNYLNLSVIALAAVDKLNDKINDLESRIAALEAKN